MALRFEAVELRDGGEADGHQSAVGVGLQHLSVVAGPDDHRSVVRVQFQGQLGHGRDQVTALAHPREHHQQMVLHLGTHGKPTGSVVNEGEGVEGGGTHLLAVDQPRDVGLGPGRTGRAVERQVVT